MSNWLSLICHFNLCYFPWTCSLQTIWFVGSLGEIGFDVFWYGNFPKLRTVEELERFDGGPSFVP